MFEVGFSEMLLIMALALIVLGPEKLPKLAAQVGRWMGRARNMARQFREQLEEEAILEETRSTRDAAPAPGTSANAASVAASGTATSTGADSATPGAAPTHANPATDEDTRHQDYAGAAYEPPTPPSAPDPAATPAPTVEPVTDHGGRGA